MPIDFEKLPSDQNITVALGPGAPLGVADVAVPTAAELNNTGDVSGMIPASQSISWNDYDLGFSESDTNNEPSLADVAGFEEFTVSNFGGGLSFFMPADYDDNSNLHSEVYDLTDVPGEIVTAAIRIDGQKRTTVPFANGDFVHVLELKVSSETNPFTPGESTRRTVGFSSAGDFSHYTIVGPHILTQIGTPDFSVGAKGRIRIAVQNRDYTNALKFSTSNGAVIDVYPGGFYEITGAAASTATVTVEDVEAGTSLTIPVTVAA